MLEFIIPSEVEPTKTKTTVETKEEERDLILKLYDKGMKLFDIHKQIGCSWEKVAKIVSKYGNKQDRK